MTLTFSETEVAEFANSQLNAALHIMSLTPEQSQELEVKARETFGEGEEAEEALAMYITWASAKGAI